MFKKIVLTLVILTLSFGMSYAGDTVYDIDTGVPTQVGGGTLDSVQWLAARFTLTTSRTITSIKGYFRDRTGGWLTAVIYLGGVDAPDTTYEITRRFYIPPTGTYTQNWYGPTTSNLYLSAGTYWIAFEVRDGDTYDGWMPSFIEALDPSSSGGVEKVSFRNDQYPEYVTNASPQYWGLKIGVEYNWIYGKAWDVSGGTVLTDAYIGLYTWDGDYLSTYYTGAANGYYYFYVPAGPSFYKIRGYNATYGYTSFEYVSCPVYKVINFE